MVEFTGQEFGAEEMPVQILKLKAREFAKAAFSNKTVTVDADGSQVLIPWQGIKHTFSGPISKIAAITAVKLDMLIERGVPAGTHPDKARRENIVAIHYYDTAVNVSGQKSVIRIVVRESRDGKRFYDHFERRGDSAPEGVTGDVTEDQAKT